MNKRIFTAALFLGFAFSAGARGREAKNCENLSESARAKSKLKIKKEFDKLWENVDTAVGVEFFMVVLHSNDRMPSSELTDAEYFQNLLKSMKRTSLDLADQGLKFDAKKVKSLEVLIQDFARNSLCSDKAFAQVSKN